MRIAIGTSRYRDLTRLAARLREAADGGFRDQATRQIRRAAPGAVPAIQGRVLAARFPAVVPKRGGRSTGLRSRLAASVRTAPLTSPPGVRFSVDGDTVSPGRPREGHSVALYTDGWSKRRWRHRAFGRPADDPKSWFNQKSDPWFGVSIEVQEQRFSRGVGWAMDSTVRDITT